jgi:hypothetical protein
MTPDAAGSAVSRADAAHQRIEELRALRQRLESGDSVGESDLELAEQRSTEARDFAESAQRDVIAAYQRSALAHISAAEASELAGDLGTAERHRRAAEADVQAAEGHPSPPTER